VNLIYVVRKSGDHVNLILIGYNQFKAARVCCVDVRRWNEWRRSAETRPCWWVT